MTPLQLGALRVLFAAVFLLAVGFSSLKTIQKSSWKWVVLSGFMGTFIPVFLFAFAETEIDSAIASVLNATTPLITLILGLVLFSMSFTKQQLLGIIVGLIGCLGLIWEGATINTHQNYWYALLVIIASACYAVNVNIIKKYMQEITPIAIATGNFVTLVIPSVLVLLLSGFFDAEVIVSDTMHTSLWYVGILAVLGTGVAKVLFNKLVQISTPVFATSVTYTIPIVAFVWGVLDGEIFSLYQLLAACVIILGVYLSNRKK